jgi:hypothetical protein
MRRKAWFARSSARLIIKDTGSVTARRVGRFLSVDPELPELGNLFGFNRYAYANNDPLNFVAPDGREAGYTYPANGGMSISYMHREFHPAIVQGASLALDQIPIAGGVKGGISGAAQASSLNLSSSLRFIDMLVPLLSRKNGFYAFESSLHVYSLRPAAERMGVEFWNDNDLWVGDYGGLANGVTFFAEDAFGVQFCVREDGVHSFDPERAAFSFLADDMEGWAELILQDCNALTGYPIAHDWQVRNGAIPRGQRLMPIKPFVLGGSFTAENLVAIEAQVLMKRMAKLALKIKGMPDGATIEWPI